MIKVDRITRDDMIMIDINNGLDIRKVAFKYRLTVNRIEQIVKARQPKPVKKKRNTRKAVAA